MNIEIIDNFLKKEDLDQILNTKLEHVNSNSLRVYHNKIDKNENIFSECLTKELVRKLNLNYHSKAIALLNKLSPHKVSLYDYSEFHIVETGANYKFPIHDDTPNKLLSGVIYLTPEKNSGTIFYKKKNGEGKKVIDWKVNRGVFFSRSERETWHSYEGDGISNRIVMVYNLMTNRVKEVFKIENKNAFLGSLRYKINPYLYRIFKKVI